MNKIVYNVCIKTKSPFNIGTGVSQSGSSICFTVKEGRVPYIPGSSVKGVLRSKYRSIKGEEKTDELFGKSGGYSSKVIVDNFYSEDSEYSLDIRTRNSINRYTHRSNEGALFSKEMASGIFKGQIEVNIDEIEKQWFELSMSMIKSLGSGKSIGCGEVEVTYEEVVE